MTLVGADLFGMSFGVIKDYIQAVAKVGGGHMIMGMSHNHAAPDTIGIYGHFPKEYVAYIGEQIVKGVAQAKAAARPVGAIHAAAKEMLMVGARVPGWFRNARNPGILDPQIAAIKIDDRQGKTIATIVNFACHVEGLEAGFGDMSADFPGYMCDKIKANLGGTCVFLNGAVGGMVSGDTNHRTHEEAKKVGLELAAELTKLAKSAPSVGSDELIHVRRRIEIPTTNSRFLAFASSGNRPTADPRLLTMTNHPFARPSIFKVFLVAALLMILFGLQGTRAADGDKQAGGGCACHQNCVGYINQGRGGPG